MTIRVVIFMVSFFWLLSQVLAAFDVRKRNNKKEARKKCHQQIRHPCSSSLLPESYVVSARREAALLGITQTAPAF